MYASIYVTDGNLFTSFTASKKRHVNTKYINDIIRYNMHNANLVTASPTTIITSSDVYNCINNNHDDNESASFTMQIIQLYYYYYEIYTTHNMNYEATIVMMTLYFFV